MTSWVTYNSPMIRNEYQIQCRNLTINVLKLEDIAPMKDAQFTKFMLNYRHQTIQFKGLHNYMKIVYMNLLILLFTSSKLRSINDESQRINN